MSDLWQEIELKRKEIIQCVQDMRKLGSEQALFEREYKKAYRSEVFSLNQLDKVAWTAAVTLAHGDTKRFDVSNRRYNRDLAANLHKAKSEELQVLKLELRILSAQLEREWSQSKERV